MDRQLVSVDISANMLDFAREIVAMLKRPEEGSYVCEYHLTQQLEHESHGICPSCRTKLFAETEGTEFVRLQTHR